MYIYFGGYTTLQKKLSTFTATASGIVRGGKSILRLNKYLTYKAGLEIATDTVILDCSQSSIFP